MADRMVIKREKGEDNVVDKKEKEVSQEVDPVSLFTVFILVNCFISSQKIVAFLHK